MAKFYSGITTGTTLDSMLAGGSEFGIFPSEDIDCSNINASGIHTVTGFLYPDGGIKDSSDSIGSAGKVLSSTGSGLAWIDPSTGSTANAVNVGTNLNSTNADQFVAFVGTSSGNNPIRVDAGIKYNPSTNVLSVPSITMSSHLNIDGNIRSVAGNLELQAVSGENGLVIKDNNAVELYFDGSATYKLATKTDGVDVRGELETDTLKVTGVSEFEGNVTIVGNVTPDADDSQDLGSSTKRWRNIFTGDLQLSNVTSPSNTDEPVGVGNEVDGTQGTWTIQEGTNDLFLINRINGKKYKFNLIEIS
tara:strand:+ start:189 stop:1103 length:915 start_codon:yes stop_codon:yes gene_type:complete